MIYNDLPSAYHSQFLSYHLLSCSFPSNHSDVAVLPTNHVCSCHRAFALALCLESSSPTW